ncbi:HPP family protein [Aestuariivivens sediminis]|uniref:CBS domain-containing protein n=1 Tax=Aestuariivivens sediminis TaxID=2913557 RepID=UPI001F570849|nr:CBS domain-containing protein [Aestuariivivens sediminis]
MIRKAPVSMIMTEHVITLNKRDSLEKAEQIFKKHNIRHLPVVTNNVVIGMLSKTDLLRLKFADYGDDEHLDTDVFIYKLFTIEQVMRQKIVSVPSSSSIKEVAEIFATKEFHALPVVDNNQLVGIVTTTDIIKYLLRQF